MIERARIVARFESSAAQPITLLLAPAGCGKSVALAHYLSTLQSETIRYDVRPEHASLLGFVRGFTEALRDVAPRARGTVADAVASALASEDPGAVLALWLTTHFERRPQLVAIDDVHHADADPASAAFLAALIARTKDSTRWIVAGRSARHLPLGTWLAYGDAGAPIDEADLRFTADEAERTARSMRSNLPARDVERLLATTAGWATAFTLALRLSEFTPDLQSAAATARALSYEFLAEHVYRLLAPQERELLAVAALLPEIDVAVLERAGFPAAAAMLDDLHRRATFLSAIARRPEGASPRYRCHDLFRDFLEHELELQGEEAKHGARLRAARALRDCGFVIPALRIFAQMRAGGEIVALLERNGFELVERAHGDAVASAIDALPERERTSNCAIVGIRGHLERIAGRYDRAQSLFERALATCADPPLRALLVAKLAAVLLNLERDPSSLLDPLAFDPSLSPALRGELLALLGVAYARAGRHAGLDRLFDEAEKLALACESDLARVQILHQLGSAAVLHGDSVRAVRTLSAAAALAVANGMHRLASLIYTNLGSNAAMNDDDLSAALVAATNAAENAAKSGALFLTRYSLARQLDIELHRGDAASLEALLQAYDDLPGPEQPQIRKAALWARAMLAAWDRRFGDAARLQLEVCEGQVFQEERVIARAACALFLLLAGRRDEALACVAESMREGKIRVSPRGSFPRARELARALCALTEALAGRGTAAARLLKRKPTVATPVTSAFIGAAAAVANALENGSALEAAAPHLETMHRQWYGGYARLFEVAVEAYAAQHAVSVTLTPAELAVMRALADGRTPKEIALATGTSIHTIRWHVRQAIAKFGCSGREQALRAAHARGLL
ncbi:MAG TPA: LuxR C-terminal-related transcriptional regulator [Verrucomicrobiae bacterium]|nr:LuxR C-terminal-related transcriptional regulator [Verrucomicrobiae bacterium]